VLFAGVYAVVFGFLAHLPAELMALDGAVFATVTGFEALILWNILKYGTEGIRTGFFRVAYYFVVGTLFVGVSLGMECGVIYAVAETVGTTFAVTLPARGLLTAAVYAFFALWYSYAGRSTDERGKSGKVRASADPATAAGAGANAAIAVTASAAGPDAPAAGTTAPEPLERITVRGGQGKIEVIAVGDIIYLGAEGDYVAIVTMSGRWLKEGTMKYFEENLPKGEFVRVHRSYIVSVSHISRIETSGREHMLVLRGSDGSDRGRNTIRISDAGYRALRQTLGL
jgi:hypothetical protein